ncbi:succinylglutamate desuccinylase/aspartoacylase family protein [Antarctobacter sp.]|uniref:succinylglutamate desuccinylase/aspartoacylase family protein n=1 Tax=Antarctobacter sp. TaxID=1872577 RepID=UPI002B2732ED|nr:succinylglutamate desuccinylase/aspartoacylase family protein [Antarctobacter sp.]
MATSLISSEMDIDAHGQQSGYLRVPHSTHDSAYGWIGVPIICLNNGPGPTILMTAGCHGDEYEGQIALARLARDLDPAQITGRLILLPTLNAPAAEAGCRVSPVDNGNLNRSFPGDPAGTPTQMIAHYLEEVLIPQTNLLVDLHSGGSSLVYPPTLLRGPGAAPSEAELLLALQDAFDLPYSWVFPSSPGRHSTGRTAMAAANRKGVPSVMAELGGAGSVDSANLALTERGLRRILHQQGLLPAYAPDPPHGTRELHVQGSVYAYDTGLFEPFKAISDTVAEGETIGLIHDTLKPMASPVEITSPHAGLVLAKRTLGQVKRGDALFQIARDI